MIRFPRRIAGLLAVLWVAAAPSVVRAQALSMSGSIGTSVEVLFPPLTGVGTRPLNFGMILPGTPSVTVNPRTNAGGEFRIMGMKNRKSITLSFVLPANLTGPSGSTIPLSFNGNFAGLCEVDQSDGLCEMPSYTTWNPVTTPSYVDKPTRYKPGRPRYTFDEFALYIGGRATPAANQAAGHYTGAIGVLLVIN